MNKVILIGRIANDLELRTNANDKNVVDFRLAVKRDADNTDFINCTVWNIQAENLVKYQNKGSLISVEGSLRINSYEDNDGNKKTYTYVLVNQIEYLQSKKDGVELDTQEDYGLNNKGEVVLSDDDLPF